MCHWPNLFKGISIIEFHQVKCYNWYIGTTKNPCNFIYFLIRHDILPLQFSADTYFSTCPLKNFTTLPCKKKECRTQIQHSLSLIIDKDKSLSVYTIQRIYCSSRLTVYSWIDGNNPDLIGSLILLSLEKGNYFEALRKRNPLLHKSHRRLLPHSAICCPA